MMTQLSSTMDVADTAVILVFNTAKEHRYHTIQPSWVEMFCTGAGDLKVCLL